MRRCCYCCKRSYQKDINYDEMNALINEYQVNIIDVRSKQEFNEGHINGAKNISVYDIKNVIQKEVKDKQSCIIVYCTSGIRSRRAQQILNSMGYTNVYNLEYGFK